MADITSRDRPGRADYGIDAPGVVFYLAVAGAGGIALGPVLWWVLGPVQTTLATALLNWGLWAGVSCLLTAGLMVWSSKVGKRHARERILDSLPWRGDERVLDVGCGRGLMLVGAARRLTTGRAVGVDVWQSRDQSGNRPEATLANARAEGVADRVEVRYGDARELPFPDNTFDVVVSNLVLHNIPGKENRARAVREIARVLKPGGRVALSDVAGTGDYAAVLRAAGLVDVARSGPLFSIFPPVRLVTGTKPAPPESGA